MISKKNYSKFPQTLFKVHLKFLYLSYMLQLIWLIILLIKHLYEMFCFRNSQQIVLDYLESLVISQSV